MARTSASPTANGPQEAARVARAIRSEAASFPLRSSRVNLLPVAASKKEKPDLQKKVHEVPHKPGVYLMRDRFNRVIYVGKARDLRKRVSSYFLPSKLAEADLKTAPCSTRHGTSKRTPSAAKRNRFCSKAN